MASSLDGFQIWLDKCTEDWSVLAPCILYKDHIHCPLSKELKVHLGSSTSFYHHNKPWLFTRDCEKPKITGALCDWEGIWALVWFLWTLLSWSMTMVHTTESHQLRSRAFPSFPFFSCLFLLCPRVDILPHNGLCNMEKSSSIDAASWSIIYQPVHHSKNHTVPNHACF